MKYLFLATLVFAFFNIRESKFGTINALEKTSTLNIERTATIPLYALRWDGKNARLSSKGKKKLEDLRKKIKNNKEIKKYMTNLDFEYRCSKVTAMVDPCKNGRAGDTRWYWREGKDVCNLPNYCPNVPGL